MRMDKFTTMFQMALADAQSIALGHDHQMIEPVHLMLAMLNQKQGSISPLLEQAGVKMAKLVDELNAAIDRLPAVQGQSVEGQVTRLALLPMHVLSQVTSAKQQPICAILPKTIAATSEPYQATC